MLHLVVRDLRQEFLDVFEVHQMQMGALGELFKGSFEQLKSQRDGLVVQVRFTNETSADFSPVGIEEDGDFVVLGLDIDDFVHVGVDQLELRLADTHITHSVLVHKIEFVLQSIESASRHPLDVFHVEEITSGNRSETDSERSSGIGDLEVRVVSDIDKGTSNGADGDNESRKEETETDSVQELRVEGLLGEHGNRQETHDDGADNSGASRFDEDIDNDHNDTSPYVEEIDTTGSLSDRKLWRGFKVQERHERAKGNDEESTEDRSSVENEFDTTVASNRLEAHDV